MTSIRQYSTEPGFSAPVDRFSFAMKKADWDATSTGNEKDFGMSVFFKFGTTDDLRVKFVERSSPAGLAGIKRGWRITKINGTTNITTSNTAPIITGIFESQSSSFTFQKPDGSSVDINLNAAAYKAHPVFFDSVYTAGSKKVGYLVFNSFLGDTTDIYTDFAKAFNNFQSNNVNDVIIDLRYNGGGYVSVAEKMINYLAPSTANGQVSMIQSYNDKYSQYNITSTVKKLGNLSLPRVFFIVSNNTASASELVINALRPYADVKMVGWNNTYGKPVGFFNIPVGDDYIFPVSFRTVNKNNEGNYFNGFTPDKKVEDGLDKNWGDPTEACLSSVLTYISTGTFGKFATGYEPKYPVENNKLQMDFKGSVETRRRF